ncbi:hypothetical protein HUJ05_012949 [Dendroctonus ponderosae]|nr:hypothetical protein HUJ05_012949 [Dendroctonus ponderosae]
MNLACHFVFIVLVSEKFFANRDRIVIIGEEGNLTIIDPRRDIENPNDFFTVKQSYKNLAPPLYSTLSKAKSFSSYELPPPYPVVHI